MIKIKAREKNGVITYKNGYKKEAEIYLITSGQFAGQFNVDYAFSKTSCASNQNESLNDAKTWVERLLNNVYAFKGGVEVEYA